MGAAHVRVQRPLERHAADGVERGSCTARAGTRRASAEYRTYVRIESSVYEKRSSYSRPSCTACKALPYRFGIVTDVVREQPHRPEAVLAYGEPVTQTLVQVHVDVQVGAHALETSRIRTTTGSLDRPDVHASKRTTCRSRARRSASRSSCGSYALSLLVCVHGEMPDHPAEARSVFAYGSRQLFALDVDQTHDLTGASRRRARSRGAT